MAPRLSHVRRAILAVKQAKTRGGRTFPGTGYMSTGDKPGDGMWAKPLHTAASIAAAAAEQRNRLWQVSVDFLPRAHDSVRSVTSATAEAEYAERAISLIRVQRSR